MMEQTVPAPPPIPVLPKATPKKSLLLAKKPPPAFIGEPKEAPIDLTTPLETRKIPMHRFNVDKGSWQVCLANEEVHKVKSLKLLTMNLDFNRKHRDERMAALLELLKFHSADIIALQEMCVATLHMFCTSPFIREQYYITDVIGNTFDKSHMSGMVICSKLLPSDAMLCLLHSEAEKRAVIVEYLTGNRKFRIANIHLESDWKDTHIRVDQLKTVYAHMDVDDAIVMGDTNVADFKGEEMYLPVDYKDVWLALRPNDSGYTYDSVANAWNSIDYKRANSAYLNQQRLDRVVLKSSIWQATSIEIIGASPISKDLCISDHFGLLCTLNLR